VGWIAGIASSAVIAVSCAGCSITEPVAVVSQGIPGGIVRGTTTAALSGGSFSVTNGTLSCGGSYNALDQSPTISAPVLRAGFENLNSRLGGFSA
jgi:hypothetical protein